MRPQRRTEFPNLLIVATILREYLADHIETLEECYPTPAEKLEAVRNMASDDGEEEIVDICDYIERQNLTQTFFPE